MFFSSGVYICLQDYAVNMMITSPSEKVKKGTTSIVVPLEKKAIMLVWMRVIENLEPNKMVLNLYNLSYFTKYKQNFPTPKQHHTL